MKSPPSLSLIVFLAHALLILEERLRERQEAGELPADMDVTDFALRLLLVAANPRPALGEGVNVPSFRQGGCYE
jgi:hypothetical protein